VATAVVQQAVASVQGRDCRELTVAPVGRCLVPELAVLGVYIGL
jgi:hypothetical protein